MLSFNDVKRFEEYVMRQDIGNLYQFYNTHPEIIEVVDSATILAAHGSLILTDRLQDAGRFYESVKSSNRTDLGRLVHLLELGQDPVSLKEAARALKRAAEEAAERDLEED